MRLYPVGLISAALVAAGALLLRYTCFRRGAEIQPIALRLREASEATLVDRLRERGI